MHFDSVLQQQTVFAPVELCLVFFDLWEGNICHRRSSMLLVYRIAIHCCQILWRDIQPINVFLSSVPTLDSGERGRGYLRTAFFHVGFAFLLFFLPLFPSFRQSLVVV